MLTEFEIEKLEARDSMYRENFGDGISLEIHPKGQKYWRLRYWDKKECRKSLGVFPEVSIEEALRRAREIKESVFSQEGIVEADCKSDIDKISQEMIDVRFVEFVNILEVKEREHQNIIQDLKKRIVDLENQLGKIEKFVDPEYSDPPCWVPIKKHVVPDSEVPVGPAISSPIRRPAPSSPVQPQSPPVWGVPPLLNHLDDFRKLSTS